MESVCSIPSSIRGERFQVCNTYRESPGLRLWLKSQSSQERVDKGRYRDTEERERKGA